jgi:hypothetical protein
MSIEATKAVWEWSRQKISGPLLVLLAVADYINKEGIAWPSVSTLARKVRMSKRNVQRWLHELEKAGELEIDKNQGRRGSNIYRIRLSNNGANGCDANVTGDVGVAKPVSSASSTGDVSVTQSVSEPKKESTPIVPEGDDIDFWVKVCLECFKQPYRLLPGRVLHRLARVISGLDKKNADSLRKFYRSEELNSKEPLYNSRRHSPERLALDLPRQLALAAQKFPPPKPPPPPKEYGFTIEEVWAYLREKYGDCRVPHSLAELDNFRWDNMRPEILEAMRVKNKKEVQ